MTLFLLNLLWACNGEEAEDPALHACEHASVEGQALEAGVDAASAPVLALSDTPTTVTLIGGAQGYLRIEASEDVAALLFASPENVVTLLQDPSGVDVLPSPAPNEDCPDEIPEHFDLDLEPGTWTLGLGPAAIETVWLFFTEAGEHGHDE